MKTFLPKALFLAILLSLPGACLWASPPVSFWTADFSLPDGTTAATGTTGWTSSVNYSSAVFGLYNHEFEANNISINGVGTWTSAPVSIAGKSNIQLSANVRSAGGLENDATTHSDYIRFYYKVDGGAEVLFSDLDGIINNNSTAYTSVSTTGTISGSTVQIIIRARATATDEFYFFNNVTVAGTDACVTDASASANGIITCTTDSVQLTGSSTSVGAAYNWSGPGGFTSALQNPFIRSGGTYTLVVTSPGGCTATTTAAVSQNTAAPLGVTATASDRITCDKPSVNLSGSAFTTGVSFRWTGPNGFTAGTPDTHATIGGTYTMFATDPRNGCTSTAPVVVGQNTAPPADVTVANSGPLTCDVAEVTLTGSTSTANTGFEWDGPDGYLSFSAQDIANEPGDYVLTVTNFDNGCTLRDTTTVLFDCNGARKATAAQATGNNAASTFEWKAYPNPFSEKAFIEFKSPESAFITVRVYNNNGICESTLFSNKAAPNQPYQLPLAGLPAGIHYVIIAINSKIYTRKLISVK